MARISCQSQLISDTWRANLATNWRFSRPRPLRERMKRKSCHGSPPENASRRDLATVGRRGHISVIGERSGMHHGEILPWPTARKHAAATSCHCRTPGERISRAFCHRQAPENASRHNLATTGRPPNAPRPTALNAPRLPLGSSPNTMPCTVRGAFAATEKVSCRLRVSMRWNEPPVSV